MAKIWIEWQEVTRYGQAFEVPEGFTDSGEDFIERLEALIVEHADFSNVEAVLERKIDWYNDGEEAA